MSEQTAHRPYKTESPASDGVFFVYLSRMMCVSEFSFRGNTITSIRLSTNELLAGIRIRACSRIPISPLIGMWLFRFGRVSAPHDDVSSRCSRSSAVEKDGPRGWQAVISPFQRVTPYYQDGLSAPSLVRPGFNFCCNPFCGQMVLLQIAEWIVSLAKSSQDKSV